MRGISYIRYIVFNIYSIYSEYIKRLLCENPVLPGFWRWLLHPVLQGLGEEYIREATLRKPWCASGASADYCARCYRVGGRNIFDRLLCKILVCFWCQRCLLRPVLSGLEGVGEKFEECVRAATLQNPGAPRVPARGVATGVRGSEGGNSRNILSGYPASKIERRFEPAKLAWLWVGAVYLWVSAFYYFFPSSYFP
jgi:hypothetical protein